MRLCDLNPTQGLAFTEYGRGPPGIGTSKVNRVMITYRACADGCTSPSERRAKILFNPVAPSKDRLPASALHRQCPSIPCGCEADLSARRLQESRWRRGIRALASPDDRIERWRGKTMCLAGPVGAAAKLTFFGEPRPSWWGIGEECCSCEARKDPARLSIRRWAGLLLLRRHRPDFTSLT